MFKWRAKEVSYFQVQKQILKRGRKGNLSCLCSIYGYNRVAKPTSLPQATVTFRYLTGLSRSTQSLKTSKVLQSKMDSFR